jgi:hypothetical protein
LKAISYTKLTEQLSKKSIHAVDKLCSEKDVHYLILLKARPEAAPKILPAGPGLDFRNPRDADGQMIRGMRAVAYVDLRAEPKAGKSDTVTRADSASVSVEKKIHALESKMSWYENELRQNEQKLRKAKRLLREKDLRIAEVTKRNQMLIARMDEYNCSGDPDTEKRLKDIENAENELIQRMNALMEKEAEIDQKDEDLTRKEQDWRERNPSDPTRAS